MSIKYQNHFSTRQTPQSQPVPGSNQVANSAGGFSFAVDEWVRLDRFLVLGTEGGSYYASEKKLTMGNAEAVKKCIEKDGLRTVNRIVEISEGGRAPKNDPAIFALAMAAGLGSPETRRAALAAIPKVCRIGTHIQHFVAAMKEFCNWNRSSRRAIGSWYNEKDPDKLAYQLVKYQERDGWSNKDLLRLSHAGSLETATEKHKSMYRWVTADSLDAREVTRKLPNGEVRIDKYPAISEDQIPEIIHGFELAKKTKEVKEIVKLIGEYDLPRECVPTEFLKNAEVWEALLPKMGLTALIRNLATMTRCGLINGSNETTKSIVERITNQDQIAKSRVHPIQMLSALMTYKSGHGVRGQTTWDPVSKIVDALDKGFYLAFKTVEPTGKRMLLALDVSGSMSSGDVAGVPGLTPRVASSAMALVTAATEKEHQFVAFTSGSYGGFASGEGNGISRLDISPRQRLDDVCQKTEKLFFGGTDCALPMIWAQKHKEDVDVFVVYTDSETWDNPQMHPIQALREYRQKRGIPAKLIVVGMVSNAFSIADPNDGGMLDVVGFDTAAPQLINDFSRQ